MRKRRLDQQKDNTHFLRSWRAWHREQLEAALAGEHGDLFAELMTQLKNLRSARELVAFVEAQDWNTIDHETRFIALHEINNAITKLRERLGLVPFDDGLPGDPENAFRIIKALLDPPRGGHVGADADCNSETEVLTDQSNERNHAIR